MHQTNTVQTYVVSKNNIFVHSRDLYSILHDDIFGDTPSPTPAIRYSFQMLVTGYAAIRVCRSEGRLFHVVSPTTENA